MHVQSCCFAHKTNVVWRCCCCKTTGAFHSTKTFENWKQRQMTQKFPGKVSRNSERCWISEMRTMHSTENSRNSQKRSSMKRKLPEKFFLKFGHTSQGCPLFGNFGKCCSIRFWKLPKIQTRRFGWRESAQLTSLHANHALLHISLPSFHDYDVKLPNFTFCEGREHKTTTLFFLFLNFDHYSSPLEFNSRKIHQHLTNCMRWNICDRV